MSAGAGGAEERLVQLVHDLRTPLTVITGFVELLQRQQTKLTDEQKADYLERVAEAAGELREILDRERGEGPRPSSEG
jgi:K+-sensing histidine kinase KdpD